MKHIKIHSFSHLLHLLYCLILALPLFSILVRSLYVQLNDNAYQSYSDVTNIYEYDNANFNDMVVGETYAFKTTSYIQYDTAPSNTAGVNLVVDNLHYGTEVFNNCRLNFLYYGSQRCIRVQINNGVTNIDSFSVSTIFNFTFDLVAINTLGDFYNVVNDYLFTYDIVSYNYLDNAFEYSLNEFTQNSNIGQLNLVNWFTDVFLDSSNATNMLYLNFINWYMNYALLVSCVYILFLVLMWFVSLARRLIYKGMEM